MDIWLKICFRSLTSSAAEDTVRLLAEAWHAVPAEAAGQQRGFGRVDGWDLNSAPEQMMEPLPSYASDLYSFTSL